MWHDIGWMAIGGLVVAIGAGLAWLKFATSTKW
jgi:hypothetical protein